MRYVSPAVAAVAVVGLVAGVAEAQQPPAATAQLRDAAGRLVGVAEFSEERSQLLFTLSVNGSTPLVTGSHAVHIHQVGRCDPPDFATAGGIFNPTDRPHGRRNPDGTEAGDLPNLMVAANGSTGYRTYLAPELTLGSGPGALVGRSGKALVISAAEDDGKTPPDGNSGARVACGVIVAGALADNPGSAPGASATQGAATDATPLVIGLLGALMAAAGYAVRRTARRSS